MEKLQEENKKLPNMRLTNGYVVSEPFKNNLETSWSLNFFLVFPQNKKSHVFNLGTLIKILSSSV